MNVRTEVTAIVAGVMILGGGVALELAGHQAPPEIRVAGTGALTGGLGFAIPGSSTTPAAAASELGEALKGELAKLAGYTGLKAPAAAPQSVPAATASTQDGPAAVALASPPATAAPAPATQPVATAATVGIPS